MVLDRSGERTHRPSTAVESPDTRTPGAEMRGAIKRLLRDERPSVAIPRDIVIVLAFLLVFLGGLWAYTGQPFPSTSPVVVVESGSMMHPDPAYGRVGTIDPGDLVLVKEAQAKDEIATAYDPDGRTGYGGKGDVIVYRPHNRADATPIIHRALTWVDVTAVTLPDGSAERRYAYHDEAGKLLVNQRSVTLESVGVREMRPEASGFITKGDNPQTNAVADQISHVRGQTVQPDWIVGKARGEVPWIGLVKLALSGNPVPANVDGQCKVLNAWAPCDTWVMLGSAVGLLIVVPFGLERAYKSSPSLRRWLS